MKMDVTFHITVDTKTKGRFRMKGEHYYSSPQVERFKINGVNNRFILMEKRLRLKRQPWKVTKVDVPASNIQEAAMALHDMQDAIDQYLKRKGGETEGHVLNKK